MASEKQNIQVFCRIRPAINSRESVEDFKVEHDGQCLKFSLAQGTTRLEPMSKGPGERTFGFKHVFQPDCTQEEVFIRAARPLVESVLQGFNGTVFATGQTSSGKTYSLTGGQTYEERGLMPRTLQHIFSHIEKDSDAQYAVRVSYFEIYESRGYDLLSRTTSEPVDLNKFPQVGMHENERGEFVCDTNLKRVFVPDLNAALNQLFIGDTNRIMCQTPSNDQSTRSHCIFTIYVDAKETNSDLCRSSKFNMVDLAGSERISKTHVSGKLLQEARYINTSLHFLERVIVALYEKRDHVPYRDSLLTKYLKDSLGGNCKTTMLATLSMAQQHLDESVSTCRFAQRVGSISNKAFVNKEVDPHRVIKRLERQVEKLKGEIAYLNEDDGDSVELVESERIFASNEMRRFFGGISANESEGGVSGMFSEPSKVSSITRLFREILHEQASCKGGNSERNEGGGNGGGEAGAQPGTPRPSSGGDTSRTSGSSSPARRRRGSAGIPSEQRERYESDIDALLEIVKRQSQGQNPLLSDRCRSVAEEYQIANLLERTEPTESTSTTQRDDSAQPSPEMLAAQTDTAERQRAYDEYKQTSDVFQKVEQQKAELKTTFAQAKSVAERLNQARAEVQDFKAKLEQTRVETALEKLTNASDPDKEKVAELENKFSEYQSRLIPAARDVKQYTLELKDLKAASAEDLKSTMWSARAQAEARKMPQIGQTPKSLNSSEKLSGNTEPSNLARGSNQTPKSESFSGRPSKASNSSLVSGLTAEREQVELNMGSKQSRGAASSREPSSSFDFDQLPEVSLTTGDVAVTESSQNVDELNIPEISPLSSDSSTKSAQVRGLTALSRNEKRMLRQSLRLRAMKQMYFESMRGGQQIDGVDENGRQTHGGPESTQKENVRDRNRAEPVPHLAKDVDADFGDKQALDFHYLRDRNLSPENIDNFAATSEQRTPRKLGGQAANVPKTMKELQNFVSDRFDRAGFIDQK